MEVFLGVDEQHESCSFCQAIILSVCRLSRWQESTFGTILSTSKTDRCVEKVAQDLAFVNIAMAGDGVNVSVLSRKYSFVDMLGIFGELQFRKHLNGGLPDGCK